MSGLKDTALAQAYRTMHAVGITTESLAYELMTARTYVSRVLGGYERRGKTWARIQRILAERCPEALELLDQVDVASKPVQATTARRASAPIIPFDGRIKTHHAAPTVRRFNQWRQEQHA